MRRQSNTHAVNAAALQQHLLKSLSLSTSLPKSNPTRSRPKSLANYGRAIVRLPKPATRQQPELQSINKKHQAYINTLSLAQRRGLVQKPQAPLNSDQWSQVQQKAQFRGEYSKECPICKQAFGVLPTVILSCSHIFHQQCLSSFQKFARCKFCPICRKQSYDKKRCQNTEEYYRVSCATKIQAWYRGYKTRQKFEILLEQFPPQHPLVRRKYFGQKLSKVSQKMEEVMKKKEETLEALFRDIDGRLDSERQAIQEFKILQRGKSEIVDPSVDWVRIRRLAVKRQEKECSVCLQSFCNKNIALLSCSHIFHLNCIQAFEYFDVHSKHSCPVCREEYSRTNYYID